MMLQSYRLAAKVNEQGLKTTRIPSLLFNSYATSRGQSLDFTSGRLFYAVVHREIR
jgi:hypothetical protein